MDRPFGQALCVNVKIENGDASMRFVLCIVIAALLPGSALAAKGGNHELVAHAGRRSAG